MQPDTFLTQQAELLRSSVGKLLELHTRTSRWIYQPTNDLLAGVISGPRTLRAAMQSTAVNLVVINPPFMPFVLLDVPIEVYSHKICFAGLNPNHGPFMAAVLPGFTNVLPMSEEPQQWTEPSLKLFSPI